MPPSLSFFFFLFSHGQRHDASVVCFGIIFRRIFIALERSLSVLKLSKKSAGCRMLLASAVKRRRLNGKQPSPPAYTSEAADGQHAVAFDLILPVEPSLLHPTEGHLGEDFGPDNLLPCAGSADGPSSLDNGPPWGSFTTFPVVLSGQREDGAVFGGSYSKGENGCWAPCLYGWWVFERSFSPWRWKSHHGWTGRSTGWLHLCIHGHCSAGAHPTTCFLQLPTRQRNKAARRSKRLIPRSWAVHRSRETLWILIAPQCKKTYLLTVSGLNAASVPEHQEIVNLALQSFVEAGYAASVYLTHMAVFREPHQDGGMYFHIAPAFSEPFRWIGWKIPCRAMVKSSNQQMQYAYMLHYLLVPSKEKPLTALDKEPLLLCRHGKSHPPLLNAINGALSCEAIQENVAEAFLQKYAAGKRTTAKFTDVELWPIVRELQVLPDEPLLLEKLLKRARVTGNERLLAYISGTPLVCGRRCRRCRSHGASPVFNYGTTHLMR